MISFGARHPEGELPVAQKLTDLDPALELVRFALAQHLGCEPEDVDETNRLEEELGLDPLDLVLVVLRLEELGEVDFPMADLEHVMTVGDLAAMVQTWWRRSCDRASTLPPPPVDRSWLD
jgi:acyl carrier protein